MKPDSTVSPKPVLTPITLPDSTPALKPEHTQVPNPVSTPDLKPSVTNSSQKLRRIKKSTETTTPNTSDENDFDDDDLNLTSGLDVTSGVEEDLDLDLDYDFEYEDEDDFDLDDNEMDEIFQLGIFEFALLLLIISSIVVVTAAYIIVCCLLVEKCEKLNKCKSKKSTTEIEKGTEMTSVSKPETSAVGKTETSAASDIEAPTESGTSQHVISFQDSKTCATQTDAEIPRTQRHARNIYCNNDFSNTNISIYDISVNPSSIWDFQLTNQR